MPAAGLAALRRCRELLRAGNPAEPLRILGAGESPAAVGLLLNWQRGERQWS